jgi:hypothetical protein
MERLLHSLFSLPVQPDWRLAAMPLLPRWLASTQILLLDGGLLLTLYLIWRIAKDRMNRANPAGVFLPWGSFALALYGIGIWILLEPMQMRGMMMN